MKIYLAIRNNSIIKSFSSYDKCIEFVNRQNKAIIMGQFESYKRAIEQIDLRFSFWKYYCKRV